MKRYSSPVPSQAPLIRKAKESDHSGVRALGWELWYDQSPHQGQYVDSVFAKYWDENYLRVLFTLPNCACVVAQQDAKIVGLAMANIQFGDPHIALLSRFCLLPSYRGCGLEHKLLRGCELALPPSVTVLQTCVAQHDEEQFCFFADEGFSPLRMIRLGAEEMCQIFFEMTKPLAHGTAAEKTSSHKNRSQLDFLMNKSPIHLN